MSMSRKHFETLAAVLRETNPALRGHGDQHQWGNDVAAVMEVCKDFNPQFDHQRFLAACGVERPVRGGGK